MSFYDPTETVDSDGDGVGDNVDAYPNDPSRTEPPSDLLVTYKLIEFDMAHGLNVKMMQKQGGGRLAVFLNTEDKINAANNLLSTSKSFSKAYIGLSDHLSEEIGFGWMVALLTSSNWDEWNRMGAFHQNYAAIYGNSLGFC